MNVTFESGWSAPVQNPSAWRALRRRVLAERTVRSACTPTNLTVGGAVVLGWLALVSWTGAGSEGWQARICSDLDVRPQSCGLVASKVALKKDESRVAPHMVPTHATTRDTAS